MTRETILTLAILLAVFGRPAKSDGIAAFLMGDLVSPCDTAALSEAEYNAMVFDRNGEDLYTLYLGRRLVVCDEPTMTLALWTTRPHARPEYGWHQPPPAPVPIPSAGLMMLAGLGMIFGIRRVV